MEIRKSEYINEIITKIAILRYVLESSNAGGIYDINREMEDFVCGLLNIIYDYNLINLACYKKNYPGIDLGDNINRVAVQVTSNRKVSKIEHTLDLFEKYSFFKQYEHLIIFILGEKNNFKGKYDRDPYFIEQNNLIDFNDLCNIIRNCNLNKVRQTYDFIKEQLGFKEDEENLISKILNKYDRSIGIINGNDFAEKHDKNIALQVEEIYELISKLKCKYLLSSEELNSIEVALGNIRKNVLLVNDYEKELLLAFKALMFINELGTVVLRQLYDFGESIYLQVVEGGAQRIVSLFFLNIFFADKKELEENLLFNEYTFEQFQRIIYSYKHIICFEPNKIIVSSGYINDIEKNHNYLFVSCAGKMNKIYMYNVNKIDIKPVAILAGLYEPVKKLKTFKDKNDLWLIAVGLRQIYVWNLEAGNYRPTYIFKAEEEIYHYSMYAAQDGKKYIIGRNHKRIFIWAIEKDETPVKIFDLNIGYNDILIIDTNLTEDGRDYCVLGGTSGDGYSNRNVYELYEEHLLDFRVKWISSERKIFGNDFGILIEHYTMVNCSFITGTNVLTIVTKHALFLFDIVRKKILFTLHQDEQQIFGFDTIVENKGIFLLLYYLHRKNQDEGKNLLRGYSVRNNTIVGIQECFQADTDMKKAVIVNNSNVNLVFFTRYFDNTIYFTGCSEMSSYKKFAVIPSSMEIVDVHTI